MRCLLMISFGLIYWAWGGGGRDKQSEKVCAYTVRYCVMIFANAPTTRAKTGGGFRLTGLVSKVCVHFN